MLPAACKYVVLEVDDYRVHFKEDQAVLYQKIWPEDAKGLIDISKVHGSDLGTYFPPPNVEWHLSPFRAKIPPCSWGTTYITRKTRYSGERVLVIMPSNSLGSIHGDLFYARVWRHIEHLNRDLRADMCFAGIEHGMIFDPTRRGYRDDKGSLVYEWEMDRVITPVMPKVPYKKDFALTRRRHGQYKLPDLVDSLEIGLHRARQYGFQRIISILKPTAYQIALSAAVYNTGWVDKYTLLDFTTRWEDWKTHMLFRYFYWNSEPGIYRHKRFKNKAYSEPSKGNGLPKPYMFWRWPHYKRDYETNLWTVRFAASNRHRDTFVTGRDLETLDEVSMKLKYNIPPNLVYKAHKFFG